MAPGTVLLEDPEHGSCRDLYGTPETLTYLLVNDLWGSLLDLLEDWPSEATFVLPAQYTDQHLGVPEDLVDFVRDLSLAETGEFDGCVYGPCVLPAVTRRAGFSLCEYHDELLTGWDHLVA